MSFLYEAVYKNEFTDTPMNVFATESATPGGGLRGVLWSRRDQKWMSAPSAIERYAQDPMRESVTTELSRAEAERMAIEILGATPLPSEEELHRMNDEGEAERRRIRGE